jgi:glyoxylase-like metal-dependent hydrolase (beta-lactamase superfamily II)
VQVGDRVLLVDTGAASDTPARSPWVPPLGPHLAQTLGELSGIASDDVTHVLLTHLHGDHTAGSVDAEGRPAFRNADYLVPAADIRLAGGDTVVTVVATPGHTPGHQSVIVEGGEGDVILAGDVVLHAVQLAEPGSRYAYDDDPEIAAHSRRDLLARWRRTQGHLGTAHLGRSWIDATDVPDVRDARRNRPGNRFRERAFPPVLCARASPRGVHPAR